MTSRCGDNVLAHADMIQCDMWEYTVYLNADGSKLILAQYVKINSKMTKAITRT